MSVTRPYEITEDQVERSSTLDRGDIGRWAININGAVHFYDNRIRADLAYHAAHGRSEQYIIDLFPIAIDELVRKTIYPFLKGDDGQMDDEALLNLAYHFPAPGVLSLAGRQAELKLARVLVEENEGTPSGEINWIELLSAVLVQLGATYRENIDLRRSLWDLGYDPEDVGRGYFKEDD